MLKDLGKIDVAIERERVRVLPDGRMDRSNAARYVGNSPQTLANWAVRGFGPRFVKVGKRCYYQQVELDRFIQGAWPSLSSTGFDGSRADHAEHHYGVVQTRIVTG